MGCIQTKEGGDAASKNTGVLTDVAKEDGFFAKVPTFTAGVGKYQQGVHELQNNYNFNKDSKLVGSGSSSSVFKCYNKANNKMIVAVKVLDKSLATT